VKVQEPLTVSFVAEGKNLDQCAPISLWVDGQLVEAQSRSAEKIFFESVALPSGELPLSLSVDGEAKAGIAEGEILKLTFHPEKRK
jgi:hypothetical protein